MCVGTVCAECGDSVAVVVVRPVPLAATDITPKVVIADVGTEDDDVAVDILRPNMGLIIVVGRCCCGY